MGWASRLYRAGNGRDMFGLRLRYDGANAVHRQLRSTGRSQARRRSGATGFDCVSTMTLTPVTSSNIAAIGYDPATRTMTVQFKNGGTFDYHDVAPHHHDEMMKVNAKGQSVGKYFHARIRGAHKASKKETAE
jgi:hypothetical protein